MGIKAKEVADPASCLNKADPEEPLFVLRAQDKRAPGLVRVWAVEFATRHGYDHPKYLEAIELAEAMEAWPRRKQSD
jgi:hypothetical protein